MKSERREISHDDSARMHPHGDDCEHCRSARIRRVSSLCSFGEAEKARLLASAEADDPPPKWLHFIGGAIESRAWIEWRRRHRPPQRPSDAKIPAWMREDIIMRDGYVCGICGVEVDHDDVHIDHIVPYSRGGKTVMSNLRVTHAKCNTRRGNRCGSTEGQSK